MKIAFRETPERGGGGAGDKVKAFVLVVSAFLAGGLGGEGERHAFSVWGLPDEVHAWGR